MYRWNSKYCFSAIFKLPDPEEERKLKLCVCPSRIHDQFPGTEMEKYALFIYESLKKTKNREFVPSRDEIEALIHRQEMTSTVYCHGGGSCKITINSHTTAGEVRKHQWSTDLVTSGHGVLLLDAHMLIRRVQVSCNLCEDALFQKDFQRAVM